MPLLVVIVLVTIYNDSVVDDGASNRDHSHGNVEEHQIINVKRHCSMRERDRAQLCLWLCLLRSMFCKWKTTTSSRDAIAIRRPMMLVALKNSVRFIGDLWKMYNLALQGHRYETDYSTGAKM